MEASRSVPANLLALENGCGVVSAWMALQHFRKRVAVAQLAKQCKHSGQRGVFAIAIAVALKRYGLDVSFHTEEDNDKKPIEGKRPSIYRS